MNQPNYNSDLPYNTADNLTDNIKLNKSYNGHFPSLERTPYKSIDREIKSSNRLSAQGNSAVKERYHTI